MGRRLATPFRGKAREWGVDELHQGLSMALMRGIGNQLLHLQMAREREAPDLSIGSLAGISL